MESRDFITHVTPLLNSHGEKPCECKILFLKLSSQELNEERAERQKQEGRVMNALMKSQDSGRNHTYDS
jgi:hypothetical protein